MEDGSTALSSFICIACDSCFMDQDSLLLGFCLAPWHQAICTKGLAHPHGLDALFSALFKSHPGSYETCAGLIPLQTEPNFVAFSHPISAFLEAFCGSSVGYTPHRKATCHASYRSDERACSLASQTSDHVTLLAIWLCELLYCGALACVWLLVDGCGSGRALSVWSGNRNLATNLESRYRCAGDFLVSALRNRNRGKKETRDFDFFNWIADCH
jgi:hypothetical protein